MVDWKSRLEKLAGDVTDGVKMVATEVGDGLRIAADDAKKVAGIGVGSIELELPKHNYRPGESINGTLRMQLTEPVEAKRLLVALRATRSKVGFERGQDGKHDKVTRNETVHREVIELGGQKLYESGSFAFALFVPEIDAPVEQGGVLGDVLRAAKALDQMRSSPITWTLMGMLEIPWRRNLSKKLPVSVSPKGP